MVIKKRTNTSELSIRDTYELFDEEKVAQGRNQGGYYKELTKMLKLLQIKESDPISSITEQLYNQYVISLMGTGLSIGSINHDIRTVRVFLYWCMEHNHIERFKIHLVKGQEEKLKFATDDEIEKLLKIKNQNDYTDMRTYTIICFILATGARSSTIRNIKIEDIDFKSHTVTYRHLKNKKIALIPLTTQVERVLKNFIKTWDTQSDYLFPDIRGCQMSEGALKLSFARYCKKRGIRPIYPHALRHSFSRLFIKNGGNAFVLQQMLTHSTLDMTRKYVRLFSDDIRDKNFDTYNPLSVLSNSKSRTKVISKRL